MTEAKKSRLLRLSFILNAFVLLMASIDIFLAQWWFWAAITLVGAFINLLGLRKSISDLPYFNLSTYLINSLLGLFNMVYFIQRGANYIQWLWMAVALFYLLLSIYTLVKMVKNIKHKSTLDEPIN
jgi:hypothetical protein